jgi:hypothetical protein
VWYGIVISTWIWGFVLFDTIASVEGVEKGLCVLIGMILSPFIVKKPYPKRHGYSYEKGEVLGSFKLREFSVHSQGLSLKDANRQDHDSTPTMTSNPILMRESLVEMRVRNVKKRNIVENHFDN